jgi:hypothetical protein
MNAQPDFGFKELFSHVVGDMAKAICERNGETKEQGFTRSRAAVHMIMGFLPRDVIEAMLSGHCVMFHELMADSVRDTLRGEADTTRRATRNSIIAMDKAFGNNLTRLERYRLRPSEGRRDTAEDALTDVQAVVPTHAPQGEAAAASESEASPAAPFAARDFIPSPEAIAACRANPEAMAALDRGDFERFARAMGIDQPSEAYLAAASAKPPMVLPRRPHSFIVNNASATVSPEPSACRITGLSSNSAT